MGSPFYTAHLAPGFLHQHRAEQELSLSPESAHSTQNKAEGTDRKGAVLDTAAEPPQ